MLSWPLIAKAITTDDTSLPLETADVHSLALVPDGSTHFASPPEATTSPVVAISVPKTASPTLTSILAKIAACESHGDLYAKNPHSSATGKYQFLKSSWEGYGRELWGTTEGHDIFSAKDQDELALFVAQKYGLSPWNASKFCWSR